MNKIKRRTMRVMPGFLLGLALSMVLPMKALALPPLPARFQGQVTINGVPAPAGVQITGGTSGVAEVFGAVTDAQGRYSLLYVKGDDPDTPQAEGAVNDAAIQFTVDNTYVQNSIFSNGSSGTLNLNINVDAATSISQGISVNAPDVVVVKPAVSRIRKQADNATTAITGGISSYMATVNGTPGGIQFLTVYEAAPFSTPSFNATTGVFSVTGASLVQPNNTAVAEIVPILTGNTTSTVTLTVAFSAISTSMVPGLNLPEIQSNTMNFRRGNAKDDANIDIFDALYIAQYIVGQRTYGAINALNAASVRHDGAGGDRIDIFDALYVAQLIVNQRNAYFQ